ncbi:transposase [Staphylothermus marinus]|uniref:transposase n=1 Tax=Staphylothermus marinus TaxID=2280 RepID=UPI00244DFBA6|nr:transposase [Staphylothermus marinus]
MILSYRVKHNYDVSEFLNSYRCLLQRAIDTIWEGIEWRRKGKRLIPIIPKSRKFKRELRNYLLQNWNYASHYVDSAIKTAYSILNSWRRNYLKGRRGRNKPVIRRKFARVKETLYTFRDWRIRVTVKPYKLSLDFDLSRAWFRKRVKGCDLGELILKENELIVTFKKVVREKPKKKIAWDMNLLSMDGFCDRGWVRVDLKPLYTLHITYENLRRKIQRLVKRKSKTARKLMEKYSRRHRNRVRDSLHKLTTGIAREFKDYEHGFEDLEKYGMFSKRKTHNRVISRQNWKQIISLMSYKASVKLLNPRNSTKTCPRCGGRMKHRKGQVLTCGKCGLKINRQLNASINLYLRMWGFPPSPSTFYRVVIRRMIPRLKVWMRRGSGVTLKGCETDDIPLMNPEEAEVDVHQGFGRPS